MSHNITVEGGKSVRLPTAGKYCDRDIVVTAQGGAEDLDAVLTEQEALIVTLQETLKGKAAGGGGGGDFDAFLSDELSTLNSNALSVSSYSCYNKYSLVSVNLPNARSVGMYVFYNCKSLVSANMPNVESLGNNTFQKCVVLEEITLPKLEALPAHCFNGCTSLKIVDLPSVKTMDVQAFSSCTSLKAVLIRNEDAVVPIQTNTFSAWGKMYVPSVLLEEYKSATNWSSYTRRLFALESITVDGTTTGEIDRTKI